MPLNTRVEFRMAARVTPISAKTASHMDAMPMVPRATNTIFIESAMTMFCQTMVLV